MKTRQQTYDARMRAAGYVLAKAWVPKEDRPKVLRFCAELREKSRNR